MKNLFNALALGTLVMAVSGCVITVNTDDESESDWSVRQERNERALRHLELGRTLSSIENELGDPDFVESFNRDGETFKVYYYRTHRRHGDGQTTKDETTPLVFVDGALVGWGMSAVDHATAK